MLTGDAIDGVEAARIGWANRSYPSAQLESAVLETAIRIAGVESDLSQILKRMVHRQFEVAGGRAAIKAGQEFQALAGHQASVQAFRADPLAAMKKIAGRQTPTNSTSGQRPETDSTDTDKSDTDKTDTDKSDTDNKEERQP